MSEKTSTLPSVTSRDGTTIAFDRLGDGPPVILVCGGSTDRMANAGVAALLAGDFTVFNYDRRGRGDSGDTPPYAVEREVEDIDAVISVAGGSAYLYGTSSGAALAFEAAASGLAVGKVALWEPPYILDPAGRPPVDQVAQYNQMISEGRRGDAVEYFMAKVVRLPAEFVAFARSQPFWGAQEALAHTLAYDATVMGDYSLPVQRAAAVSVPVLVITGGASFPFMRETAQALAEALPEGRTLTLEGQEHNVAPEAIAPVLKEFFAGGKSWPGRDMRFRAAILLSGKTATGIRVPDTVMASLGASKKPAVRVTINGHTYRSTVATVDGLPMVGISAENRAGAGVAAGDEVDVDIELDTAPREVNVPADFADALDRDPDARRTFEGLSYSNRQWHVLAIEGAKTAETRQRRVARSIESLRAGRPR